MCVSHFEVLVPNGLPPSQKAFEFVRLKMPYSSELLIHISDVSISVISSTLRRFLRAGIVSLTFVVFTFLVFYFFIFIFLERQLVLYFSLVAPAICYLFFLHVVL